jgi:hypothetical protein
LRGTKTKRGKTENDEGGKRGEEGGKRFLRQRLRRRLTLSGRGLLRLGLLRLGLLLVSGKVGSPEAVRRES